MQQKDSEPEKDALLEAFPAQPEHVEFDVELPNGKILHVRAKTLRDSSEGDDMFRRSQELVDVIQKGMVPPDWRQWLPCSQNVAQFCFYISELLVLPRVTMVEALEWAKTRHPLIPTLGAKLFEQVVGPIQIGELQEIEARKNGSGATVTSEPS